MVSVEDTLPVAGIVTMTGVGGLTVTPLGAAPFQPTEKLTVELNAPTDDSTISTDSNMPGVSDITAGED